MGKLQTKFEEVNERGKDVREGNSKSFFIFSF